MSNLPVRSWARYWSLLCVLLLFGISTSAAAQGFEPGQGVVQLTDWPDAEAQQTLRYDILPFIDTLTAAYRYGVDDGRPILSLTVDWVPGESAIYRGVRRPTSEVPGTVRMAALDLRADVLVNGNRAATISVVVDSMVVGPYPDFVEIELPDLTWENVFVDTSPDAAKTIFLNGFELANLTIAGAAFAMFDDEGHLTESEKVRRPRRGPTRVSIYRAPQFVDVFVDVTWLIGGFSGRPSIRGGASREVLGRGSGAADGRSRPGRSARDEGDRSARTTSDEGERPARGADARDAARDEARESGRRDGSSRDRKDSGDRSGSKRGLQLPDSDDDEDDDDDDELVPYALAAVGAAGILAAVGGTIGYYGSSRHAPMGLTSGFIRRDGGLLLQAAVNEALLFDEPQPKRLIVKLLSFGNFLNSGIQPAIGAGVLATSEGEGIEYEPTLSVGAVGVLRMFLVYGGYDVIQQGPEFSVAVNFRELGWWKSGKEAE